MDRAPELRQPGGVCNFQRPLCRRVGANGSSRGASTRQSPGTARGRWLDARLHRTGQPRSHSTSHRRV